MDSVTTLSQWQFAITSVYHFFFVPLTLGLSVLVAIMETFYVRTGEQVYKRMTKFWGTLFLINFAMGVVTGIVQEFQFGMNWSEYSRLVGDVFGVPLAIEALVAFFLESTFLGLWIFGWEKLSKKMHLTAIWLVAIGSNLSALWILVANSYMQAPPLAADGTVLKDIGSLLANPNVWVQFPHTVASGFTTGAFFVLGISAYHLLKKKEVELFKKSFNIATVFGAIAVVLVVLIGHQQAQHMIRTQPMKMASAEALWVGEDPASFSILTIVDQEKQVDIVSLPRIPYVLSILAYNAPTGRVAGILDLQEEYAAKYGPGNYIPDINVAYWSFRIMVGAGMLMLLLCFYLVIKLLQKRPSSQLRFLGIFPFAIALPYLANSFGWILTEMGRQPWLVFGILKTKDGVSPNVTAGMVWTSLILFTLVYALLMFADVYLLVKFAKAGPAAAETEQKERPANEFEAYVE
ncbi:MAG: cytochrome ubiquinol oxidase subunit I [Anaerolineaceae bacterium]|nr:cytochrome ubiquinol oxidase subunit I [Anaerolineaceae bacterium]